MGSKSLPASEEEQTMGAPESRNTKVSERTSDTLSDMRSLLTELSNLARLRRPPSTMFSRLISVLPRASLFLLDEDPGAPSPLV